MLFNITYPLITKIAGKSLDLNSLAYKEEYANAGFYDLGSRLAINTNAQIEKNYIERTKNDIKVRLNDKGYSVSRVELKVETINEKRYGEITQIELEVSKKEEMEKNNESSKVKNIDKITNVDIKVLKNTSDVVKSNNDNTECELSEESRNEIKSLLELIYGVDQDNIYINI